MSTISAVHDVVVADRTDRFWRADDLAAIAPAPAAGRALARLAHAGELRRVRRGLYWRGRPTPFGMSHPPRPELLAQLLGPVAVGPAHLSAANGLGLTTQVPALDIVAVPRRPPRPVRGVRFVDRSMRTGRVRARLSPVEVGLLEVLGAWERVVDLEEPDATTRILELVHGGTVRVDALLDACAQEPARARERLYGLLV